MNPAAPVDRSDPRVLSALSYWADLGIWPSELALAAPARRTQALAPPSSGDVTPSAPMSAAGTIADLVRANAAARASTPAPATPSRAGFLQIARDSAAAAGDLEGLKAALGAFEGLSIRASARNLVFADGVPGAPVMVIGEAPGRDEDEAGRPFVGQSGRLLDQMLAAIGLDRARNCYLTNVLNWRVPGNRAPSADELALCLPFLRRHIELAAPRALLLIGGAAALALLGSDEGIMRLRGRVLRVATQPGEDAPTWPAMVLFHPAYLARRPQEKALAWADLLMFEALLADTPPAG